MSNKTCGTNQIILILENLITTTTTTTTTSILCFNSIFLFETFKEKSFLIKHAEQTKLFAVLILENLITIAKHL